MLCGPRAGPETIMADSTKAKRLQVKDELHACPSCGYKDGFHVSFRREGGSLRIVLICPQCSARFDIDWSV